MTHAHVFEWHKNTSGWLRRSEQLPKINYPKTTKTEENLEKI
jgi:hypothetical protein